MKRLLLSLIALGGATPLPAQQQADAYYDPAAMATARATLMHEHGNHLNWLILGERFEHRFDDDSFDWEAQGWIGGDEQRLWLKTEGHAAPRADEAELQLLYSRPFSPWWDVQAGLRADFGSGPDRQHTVIGVQGLAPWWFEVDAAAFLDTDGRLGARLEFEYDLRLTQRLLLQPRLELNLLAKDDRERGVARGLHEAGFGLRLRYEIRREFAPYLGLDWQRAFGPTADLRQTLGADAREFSVIAGLRLWY